MKKEKHETDFTIVRYIDFKSSFDVVEKIQGITAVKQVFRFEDFSSLDSFRGKLLDIQSPLCHHFEHKPNPNLSPPKK